jgi:hypothetical protein
MARSKSKAEEEKQMTIYFDKRAFAQKEQEEQEELEKVQNKEEATKAIVFLLSLLFVKPLVLMLLWNWLVPGIFGLAAIGYFKALGLYLLSRIIFDKE